MHQEESAILRMFAAGDGLYFGRKGNGDVRILKVDEHTSKPESDVIIEADTWVSAVTSVAKDGDSAHAHMIAKELHLGEHHVDR